MSVTAIRMAIPLFSQRLHPVLVLRSAMVGTALVFGLYPLAPNPWLMGACAVALGVTLGCVQPMVMSMLHDLTPDQRHGETLAFRSMAINASSTVMPLIFGATGAVLGAAVLFWGVGGAVGGGASVGRGRPVGGASAVSPTWVHSRSPGRGLQGRWRVRIARLRASVVAVASFAAGPVA